MKKVLLLSISIISLLGCNSEIKTNTNVSLATNMDSVSYAIGTDQAIGLLNQVPDLNVDVFIKGFLDVVDSTELEIPELISQGIIQTYGEKLIQEQRAKQQEQFEARFAEIKESGVVFLEANKTNPDVKTTASGLQYIIIKEGNGKQPENSKANVTIHYKGMTIDGKEFKSTIGTNPYTFTLDNAIPGWTEGLQLMKEGAKYKFFIPQELAYGPNPRQASNILPFMALIYEIELIKVN